VTGEAAISPAYPTYRPRDNLDLLAGDRYERDRQRRPFAPAADDASQRRTRSISNRGATHSCAAPEAHSRLRRWTGQSGHARIRLVERHWSHARTSTSTRWFRPVQRQLDVAAALASTRMLAKTLQAPDAGIGSRRLQGPTGGPGPLLAETGVGVEVGPAMRVHRQRQGAAVLVAEVPRRVQSISKHGGSRAKGCRPAGLLQEDLRRRTRGRARRYDPRAPSLRPARRTRISRAAEHGARRRAL